MKKRWKRLLPLVLVAALLLSCSGCGKKDESSGSGGSDAQKEESVSNSDGLFTLNYSATAGMNP